MARSESAERIFCVLARATLGGLRPRSGVGASGSGASRTSKAAHTTMGCRDAGHGNAGHGNTGIRNQGNQNADSIHTESNALREKRFALSARSGRPLLLASMLCVLAACSTSPESDRSLVGPVDIARDGPPPDPERANNVPDAVPRAEPFSRYGNPPSYEVFGVTYHTLSDNTDFVQKGIASWYGRKFHGRRTSSGEPFDMYGMTAAHRTLPIPSYVEVRHLGTGRRIVVRVNDRGPFHEGRIIDLSYAAAVRLGIAEDGTGPVEIRSLQPDPAVTAQAVSTHPDATVAEIDAVAPQAAANAIPNFAPNVKLQVGAFNDRANAERLRDTLVNQFDWPVSIAEAATQPTYRVQIGPLPGEREARVVDAELERLGFGVPHRIFAREL